MNSNPIFYRFFDLGYQLFIVNASLSSSPQTPWISSQEYPAFLPWTSFTSTTQHNHKHALINSRLLSRIIILSGQFFGNFWEPRWNPDKNCDTCPDKKLNSQIKAPGVYSGVLLYRIIPYKKKKFRACGAGKIPIILSLQTIRETLGIIPYHTGQIPIQTQP